MSRMRDEFRAAIGRALEEGRARGLEGRELRRHVVAAFPWSWGAPWHHRAWKQEVGRALKPRTPATVDRDAPGQGRLFA